MRFACVFALAFLGVDSVFAVEGEAGGEPSTNSDTPSSQPSWWSFSDMPSTDPTTIRKTDSSDVPSTGPSLAPSDFPSMHVPAVPSNEPTISENWPIASANDKGLPSDYPSLVPTHLLAAAANDDGGIESDIPSLSPSNTIESSELTSDAPSSVPSALVPVSDYPSLSPSVASSEADKMSLWPSDMPSFGYSDKGLAADVISDTPSLVPTVISSLVTSIHSSTMPSDMPSKGFNVVDVTATSNNLSSIPTKALSSLSDAPSVYAAVSDFPSFVPSSVSSDAPSALPSLAVRYSSSYVPSSYSAASDNPSLPPTHAIVSDIPSSVPIAALSITPSDMPSLEYGENGAGFTPSILPSVTPLSEQAVSDYPSDVPSMSLDSTSLAPSKSFSVGSSDVPSSAVGEGGTSASDYPSVVSSLVSTSPSNMPSVVSIGSDVPSEFLSDYPSSQPSLIPSDQPSLATQSFSSQPSNLYNQQGSPDTTDEPTSSSRGDGVVMFESSSSGIMDDDTVAIFEEVVGQEFLPRILPVLHAAKYSQTKCKVVSQALLRSSSERMLQEEDASDKQTAKLLISTEDVEILLRITSNVDPPSENFDKLVNSALKEYPKLLQQLLSNGTEYFEAVRTKEPDDGSTLPPAPVAAIERGPTTADTETIIPVMVIIGAVVGGVVVAFLVAFFLGKRDAYRPPSERRTGEDCSIVFSESQGDVFPFGRMSEQGRGGIMIQTSFSSISGSNMPNSTGNMALSPGPFPLVTPINVQTGPDGMTLHPKSSPSPPVSPTASSRQAKSPAVSPRSRGSAVSPLSQGSAMSPRSMTSAGAPSPKSIASASATSPRSRQAKSPGVSPRSRGSAASSRSMKSSRAASPRSMGSASATSPRSVNATFQGEEPLSALAQSIASIENILDKHSGKFSPKRRQSLETDLNQSSVAGDVKPQGKNYATSTFSEEEERRPKGPDSNQSARFDAIGESISEETSWEKDAKASSDEESNELSGLGIVDCVSDGSIQQPPRMLTAEPNKANTQSRGMFDFLTGNSDPSIESVDGQVESSESFATHPKPTVQPSVSERRVATVKPVMPLVVNTKHALHTGLVLDDLGDMEQEWKGQLDSTTTTTSTTPKSENRERFKKPPRNILYDGRILGDDKSI